MSSGPVIEDNFEDVLSKAMRGLGMDVEALAAQAGVRPDALRRLLSGRFEEGAVREVAGELNLNDECLVGLAKRGESPAVDPPDGVVMNTNPFPVPGYEEMTVNSYSLAPPGQSEEGALIDAGASYESIVRARGQPIGSRWKLFLTHTHADHIPNFDELSRLASKSYSPADEPYKDAEPVQPGDFFEIGPWQLKAVETPGHSPGGMSYLLKGAATPVVFVGDALFCYSIGKVDKSYETALNVIRDRILSLPGSTIICPGHGPLTTVEFEKKHNPFFA